MEVKGKQWVEFEGTKGGQLKVEKGKNTDTNCFISPYWFQHFININILFISVIQIGLLTATCRGGFLATLVALHFTPVSK